MRLAAKYAKRGGQGLDAFVSSAFFAAKKEDAGGGMRFAAKYAKDAKRGDEYD